RVANRDRRKIGRLDLQERQVARLVGANQLRLEAATVGEFDADVVGGVDHVVVRENVAVAGNDHAGSQSALTERARRHTALSAPASLPGLAELLAEEPPQHVLVVIAELSRPDLGS